MIKDPKELGIPNICFSISNDVDNPRAEEYKKQRVERGFDDSETWSLDCTIAKFIIPRLERYIELSDKIILRSEEQKRNIRSILTAMELTIRNDGLRDFTKEEEEQVQEGLQSLADNWFSLWW